MRSATPSTASNRSSRREDRNRETNGDLERLHIVTPAAWLTQTSIGDVTWSNSASTSDDHALDERSVLRQRL